MVAKPDFETFYHAQWGERWELLQAALRLPSQHFARPNVFYEQNPTRSPTYYMDKASLYPVWALDLQPHDKFLDLCAAPGGKSLVAIEKLAHPENIVLNEISLARKQRLIKVLKEYLPDDLQKKIKVANRDGSRWGLFEQNVYDKILVDAPCSGERHLLHDAKELKTWSPSRSKNLAKRQYALLCSALLALKPGGRLAYSTCAISKLENDAVIERLLTKKNDAQIIAQNWDLGEKTTYGWQILPDRDDGWGPIYFALVEKKESVRLPKPIGAVKT